MKKVKYCLLAMTLAMTVLSSCAEEGRLSESVPVLGIVKSEITFAPEGGVGTIEVSCEGKFEVEAEQQWCHVAVEGSTVTVTVGEYGGLENRYSSIFVTSGDESLRVTAEQFGVYAKMERGLSYVLDDGAADRSVPVVSNSKIKVESSDDWISGYYDGEKVNIHISGNDSGHIRSGWLYVVYGDQRDSIAFSQGEIKDIYGSYVASGTDKDGNPASAEFEITARNDTSVTVCVPEYDWSFYAVFDQNTLSLSIPNRQYVGPVKYWAVSWNAFVCVFDSDLLSFSILETLRGTAPLSWDRNAGKAVMSFIDDGSWGAGKVDGLIFVAFRYMIDGIPSGSLRYPLVLGNLRILGK